MVVGPLGGIRSLSRSKARRSASEDYQDTLRLQLLFSALVTMLLLSSASAEMCDLLNPNACGLYDCGGNSWSPDETQGNGDNLSLRSGQVDMIGDSRVCMKVAGPGLIKFAWKVDPLAQHVGSLGFWVDNAQVAVCRSQGWVPVSCFLWERRDYNLAWQFLKFKSVPAGIGMAWIDDLDVITNSVSPKKNPQMDNSSQNISTDNQGSDYKTIEPIAASKIVIVDEKFADDSLNLSRARTIDDGISKAPIGGIVEVHNGTYEETIRIDKSLTLCGVGNTIITNDKGCIIEIINEDDVTIRNVTIQNFKYVGKDITGIKLSKCQQFKLIDSNIVNCSTGVHIKDSDHIYLNNTRISSLSNQKSTRTWYGIKAENTSTWNLEHINISLICSGFAVGIEHNNDRGLLPWNNLSKFDDYMENNNNISIKNAGNCILGTNRACEIDVPQNI
jgi:hypothetical protein